MGKNLGSKQAQGICQLTKSGAVADLVAAGYKNRDGSTFKASDRGDPQKNLDAAAQFLVMCRNNMTAAGCPASDPPLWSWTLAAYNIGPTGVRATGRSLGWVLPAVMPGAPSQQIYGRYYSIQAILNGKANYRNLA